MVTEASALQIQLNAFESEVKAQCSSLEASVTEIDKMQEVSVNSASKSLRSFILLLLNYL